MVLKIHGNVLATCTKRVRTVCEELGVPYEIVTVDLMNKQQKSPEHLAIQPFGQIPYIDDDGFHLFESRAIARYIALKYGGVGKIIPSPTDLQKTALFEQAASVELSNFDAFAAPIVYEAVAKKRHGMDADLAAVESLTAKLEAKLAGYEAMLSKTKYLAGDELTIADLFHLPYGSLLPAGGIDFLESGKFPNVTRWWKDISSRESWKKASAE